MSDSVFGKEYADAYDLLYTGKDYNAECDMIEEVFKRYGDGFIKSILDLGCGTGNHAIPLARRGYKVTGVDFSSEMLARASSKVHSCSQPLPEPQPVFLQGDMRSLDLDNEFDAVLMMFAVLGYQLTNDDVLAALCTVRNHLTSGGLFICDVWYGPAVLAIRPSDRVKIVPIDNGKVIRAASGKLDTYHHLAEIHYHIWRLNGQQLVNESQESHQIRYFFPQELGLFLSCAKLQLLGLCAFGDLERAPNEGTWNVLVIGSTK